MGLWEDIRFAARLLVKDKWFSLVAAVALALGIGVNATVFTFVNAVLIRGLPFDDPDTIMAINSFDPVKNRNMGVSYLDFKDWAAATQSFSSLAAYTGGPGNLSEEGKLPERFAAALVSANTFKLIGQSPMLGRDFVADDDKPGAQPVVLIGSGIFKNRYGSDPSIIGRVVRVNDVASIVIGVMPEGFKFPQNADLWQPLAMVNKLEEQKRNSRGIEGFGRLKPGVSRDQAQAEMITIGQRLQSEYPDTNKDIQPKIQTFNERVNGGPIRSIFLSLMGAVSFVLLIACANVANLLLARSAQRAREISVRVSLGATRWRIVRQLLLESVMLAMIAGIGGLAIANAGIRMFDAATQDVGKPYWIQFTMDGTVVAFFAAICLGTGVIFGLAPALHVSKTDVNEVLKEGGRSGSAGIRARRWTSALIVVELALTVVLLAGAGFMMRNFLTLYSLDLGVETSHLITMRLQLPDRKYPALEQRLAFYQQLEDRLHANPQIKSVSITSNLPLQGGFRRLLTIDNKAVDSTVQRPAVTMLTVDPHYFDTMGLPLTRGRQLTDEDGMTGRVAAVINQRFAQLHFPNQDPLGHRISLEMDLQGAPAPTGGIPSQLTATIVGISPNVRQSSLQDIDPDAVAYLPFRTDPRTFMTLLARSEGDPNAMVPLIREEVRNIDADLPVFDIRTLDANLAQQRWPFRIFGSMFAFFAFIALTLSAVGLYAVTAYSVTQRAPEIGVRMALGAQSKQVTWLFMRLSCIHLAIGLSIGVAGAFGVGQIFKAGNLLVQNSAQDPITIVSIALLLAVVALTASILPAHRATKLDPLLALRRD